MTESGLRLIPGQWYGWQMLPGYETQPVVVPYFLSPELRDTVNRMDFADFLAAVDRLGALQHGTDGTLRILAG